MANIARFLAQTASKFGEKQQSRRDRELREKLIKTRADLAKLKLEEAERQREQAKRREKLKTRTGSLLQQRMGPQQQGIPLQGATGRAPKRGSLIEDLAKQGLLLELQDQDMLKPLLEAEKTRTQQDPMAMIQQIMGGGQPTSRQPAGRPGMFESGGRAQPSQLPSSPSGMFGPPTISVDSGGDVSATFKPKGGLQSSVGKIMQDIETLEAQGQTDRAEALKRRLDQQTGRGLEVKEMLAERNRIRKNSSVFLEQRQSFNQGLSFARAGTAFGDVALVFALMKVLDPKTSVREGERASAENAASIEESVRNWYNRALEGTSLTPQQRQDVIDRMKEAFGTAQAGQQRMIEDMQAFARRNNLDPADLIPQDVIPQREAPDTTLPQQSDPSSALVDFVRRMGRNGTSISADLLEQMSPRQVAVYVDTIEDEKVWDNLSAEAQAIVDRKTNEFMER